ncbi:hypothetical protein [Promicromonospora sp. NPDC023805]|uniref:hypothetical protein n=1 Tax=Promicromonospora sp. NPDC023805 TaxID=3154696 RepID=UPI00340D32B5
MLTPASTHRSSTIGPCRQSLPRVSSSRTKSMSRARPRVTHAPTSALFSRSLSRHGATLPSGNSMARASYVWSTPATT